jgi:hypothetical protein
VKHSRKEAFCSLLDLDHASRLDQIEAALAALGKRLTIDLSDAA